MFCDEPIIKVFKLELKETNCFAKNQPKIRQKSPQVVKHVVKGEKWACSTPKTGKNKPLLYITKTGDFKRFCEE